jgi:hypothetical protein
MRVLASYEDVGRIDTREWVALTVEKHVNKKEYKYR